VGWIDLVMTGVVHSLSVSDQNHLWRFMFHPQNRLNFSADVPMGNQIQEIGLDVRREAPGALCESKRHGTGWATGAVLEEHDGIRI